jgi:hypothetical protein
MARVIGFEPARDLVARAYERGHHGGQVLLDAADTAG